MQCFDVFGIQRAAFGGPKSHFANGLYYFLSTRGGPGGPWGPDEPKGPQGYLVFSLEKQWFWVFKEPIGNTFWSTLR